MANGEGSPSDKASIRTKTAAIKASTIWLPTNEPTRAMIAKVSLETLSLRVAGTNRIVK